MKRLVAFATMLLPFATAAQTPGADVTLGQRIATQGGGDAVTACATCHGARGEGNAAANSPRLAAQPAEYLAHQLDSYADGSRMNPVMAPIARAMRAEQRTAVAAYYAQLDAPPTKHPVPKVQAATIARARTLAVAGDEKRKLQACVNCHGPEGRGLPPGMPYLAGQDPEYTMATLTDWRNGARRNDPSGQMPIIAKQLEAADATALAAYFGSRPPPKPTPAIAQRMPDTRSARRLLRRHRRKPGPELSELTVRRQWAEARPRPAARKARVAARPGTRSRSCVCSRAPAPEDLARAGRLRASQGCRPAIASGYSISRAAAAILTRNDPAMICSSQMRPHLCERFTSRSDDRRDQRLPE